MAFALNQRKFGATALASCVLYLFMLTCQLLHLRGNDRRLPMSKLLNWFDFVIHNDAKLDEDAS